MRPTWRGAAGVELPLLSGPRAAGGAALLAGAAMCALGSASARAWRPAYVAGALGSIALAVEVWTIVALWLFATVHNAVAGDPVEPPPAEAMLQHYKEALPPRAEIH